MDPSLSCGRTLWTTDGLMKVTPTSLPMVRGECEFKALKVALTVGDPGSPQLKIEVSDDLVQCKWTGFTREEIQRAALRFGMKELRSRIMDGIAGREGPLLITTVAPESDAVRKTGLGLEFSDRSEDEIDRAVREDLLFALKEKRCVTGRRVAWQEFPFQLLSNFWTEAELLRNVEHLESECLVDVEWSSGPQDPQRQVAALGLSRAGVKEAIKERKAADIDNGLQGLRVCIEDVEEFREVRRIQPRDVLGLLTEDGRINLLEDDIQSAIEGILAVPSHARDWGGEDCDLYTGNLTVNRRKTLAAFLLKGRGLRKPVLEIADCGKNGDQLVRLFQMPAELYVVQFVGMISENLIKDIEGKTAERRSREKLAWFCIVNGQDTARLLVAYGKMPQG